MTLKRCDIGKSFDATTFLLPPMMTKTTRTRKTKPEMERTFPFPFPPPNFRRNLGDLWLHFNLTFDWQDTVQKHLFPTFCPPFHVFTVLFQPIWEKRPSGTSMKSRQNRTFTENPDQIRRFLSFEPDSPILEETCFES